MLDVLSKVMDAFGTAIVVPVIIFFIALLMKVKPKKAFNAALNAGIGLTGFNMIIGAYTPIVTPAINRMVEETGVNLRILDTGWQATSVVAYSTQVGMIFLALGLALQAILFVIKFTDIFMPSDLWNNYSFMLWGSMLYISTKNLWLSIGLMVLSNLYCLVFTEIVAKRWSVYYGYPRCTMSAPHHICSVPLAMAMDWILTKLGANKVRWNPETLQDKLGFFRRTNVIRFHFRFGIRFCWKLHAFRFIDWLGGNHGYRYLNFSDHGNLSKNRRDFCVSIYGDHRCVKKYCENLQEARTVFGIWAINDAAG